MAVKVEVMFVHPDGERELHAGAVGDTLLDVALDNGVSGIIGQCGGGATCCTCHCWIDEAWLNTLDEMHQDERDMLVYAWGQNHRSRLACQVGLHTALSGIRVFLPEQQS